MANCQAAKALVGDSSNGFSPPEPNLRVCAETDLIPRCRIPQACPADVRFFATHAYHVPIIPPARPADHSVFRYNAARSRTIRGTSPRDSKIPVRGGVAGNRTIRR